MPKHESGKPASPAGATRNKAQSAQGGDGARKGNCTCAKAKSCDTGMADAYEKAPMGYFRATPEGALVSANTRLAHIFGYASVQDVLDYAGDLKALLNMGAQERQRLASACARNPAHMEEMQTRRRDGTLFWAAVSVHASKDHPGKALCYEGFVNDITAQRRLQETIWESEAKYRTVVDNISDIYYRSDTEGRLIMASPSAAKALGYDSVDDMLGLPVRTFWRHPEERANFLKHLHEKGEVHDFELALACKDGASLHCSASSRYYHDSNGNVLGIEGIVRDITERRQTEEALRRSEMLLSTLVDTIPDLVWLKNADGVYLSCNPSFQRLFGLGKTDFIGKTDYEIFDADVADHFRTYDLKAIQAGKSRMNEEWVTHCEGHRVLLETVKTPMYEPNGVLVGVLGVARDITARKQTEEALEKRIIALTRPLKDDESIDFEDIFNLADLQRMQDMFSKATGVASIITKQDGSPITAPSNFCRLCSSIIRKTEKGLANCLRSDAIMGRPNQAGPVVQPCMSGGLWDAGAPITVGGRHIGSWLIGQVRDETQTEEDMRTYARQIGADEDQVVAAFKEVPAMSQERFGLVAEALYTLANQLSTIAYQNVQQARLIADMKQAESMLRLESAFNQAQADLAQAITAPGSTIASVTTMTLEQARALTGSSFGFVASIDLLLDDTAGHTLSGVMSSGRQAVEEHSISVPKDPWTQVLNTREPFVTDTPQTHGTLQHLHFGDVPLTKVLASPAMYGGEFMGLIVLANPARDYTREDLDKVKPLADLFALSVQRMRYIESLKASKEAAEAASRAKSEFLANMSHEIRTPLNGVFGMLQLLEHASLTPREGAYVQHAIGATKRLTQLLSDILDLSRIEAGKMPFTREEFDIFDLGPAITDIFGLRAREKGLGLSVHMDERLPPRLLGDRVRIRQILFNLVGNALKFTEKGSVSVNISPLTAQDNSRIWVLIAVKDTGIGIADEDVDRVFEPFAQIEGLLVRTYGGSGLGLSIVRKLLQLMNGSMTISSEMGEGTEFYVSIPLELPESSSQEEALPPTALPTAAKHILVVEDEPINQLCLKEMLEREGYQVSTADNGQEALDLLDHSGFDCILMDVQMPIMDGIEATLTIRKQERFGDKASTPIIALTAYALQGDRERCLNAGMDSYLSKPIKREALLSAVGAFAS